MFFAWTFFFFAIDIFCTYCIYWSHVKIYILYIFPQIFPNKDLAKLRECVYIRDKLLTTKLEEHKVKHKLSPTQFSNFFFKEYYTFPPPILLHSSSCTWWVCMSLESYFQGKILRKSTKFGVWSSIKQLFLRNCKSNRAEIWYTASLRQSVIGFLMINGAVLDLTGK